MNPQSHQQQFSQPNLAAFGQTQNYPQPYNNNLNYSNSNINNVNVPKPFMIQGGGLNENTFGSNNGMNGVPTNQNADYNNALLSNNIYLPPPKSSQTEVVSPKNVHFHQNVSQNENSGGYFTQKSNGANKSIYQPSITQIQGQNQESSQDKTNIISLLNEKLTSMNNEVSRLASQTQSLSQQENQFDYLHSNTVSSGDDFDSNKLSYLCSFEL